MEQTIKKLKFKGKGVVINAPATLEQAFVQLDFATTIPVKTRSTNTLVFINNQKEYTAFLTKKLKDIEPDSVLWFAYPKGTSKVITDINRDTIRATGEEFGITTVTAISIDDTWSALRFRPVERVGK